MPDFKYIAPANQFLPQNSVTLNATTPPNGVRLGDCKVSLNPTGSASQCRIDYNPDTVYLYGVEYVAPPLTSFKRPTEDFVGGAGDFAPWLFGSTTFNFLPVTELLLPLAFAQQAAGCIDQVVKTTVNSDSGVNGTLGTIPSPYMGVGSGIPPGSDDGFKKTPDDGLERRGPFSLTQLSWDEKSTTTYTLSINSGVVKLLVEIDTRQSKLELSGYVEQAVYDAGRASSVPVMWTPVATKQILSTFKTYQANGYVEIGESGTLGDLNPPNEDDWTTHNPRHVYTLIYQGTAPDLTATADDILVTLNYVSGSVARSGYWSDSFDSEIRVKQGFTGVGSISPGTDTVTSGSGDVPTSQDTTRIRTT